jgi:hypothetical protein
VKNRRQFMRNLALACLAPAFTGRAAAASASLPSAGPAAAAPRRARRLVIVNGWVLTEADLAAIVHAR